MKYLCYLLLFTCIACQENTSFRAMELYARLDKHKWTTDLKKDQLLTDSIVKAAATLHPAEYCVIVFKTANYYFKHASKDIAAQYLEILDSLSFPEINNKTTGFLLLQEYEKAGTNNYYKPKSTDLPKLASLLFDMENRQRLTPSEKCDLLTLKANIYNEIFEEPTAAFSIISQTIQLAQQHNISGTPLWKIYITLANICFKLDNQTLLLGFSHELQDLIDKAPTDGLYRKETLSYLLFTLYHQHQDYPQVLYWLRKSGMTEAEQYKSHILKFYLDIDSIPAAFNYLEKHRQTKIDKHKIFHTRKINWHEALIYQHTSDTARYEQLLRKAIRAFDQAWNQSLVEVDNCAPSEAYARLLWKQGKLDEAIHRMEIVTRQLTSRQKSYNDSLPYSLKLIEQKLERLQFLTRLYEQAQRPDDALRQTQLCDSIRKIYEKSRLTYEQKRNTTRIYIAEFQKNLDLKAIELLQEQHKLYTIALFLGITLLSLGILLLLYHRRKKQLDILYTLQKANEQRQEEKQQTQSSVSSALSPEEQLFSQLEKQFYDKQLFRNPDFSRDDLCRLGVSNRMYISTCINKYTGGNINQWINKARVNYAIQLICSGETNLQVIAETSGFSSTTSFFRNFKQFTQLTPKQYIQRAN